MKELRAGIKQNKNKEDRARIKGLAYQPHNFLVCSLQKLYLLFVSQSSLTIRQYSTTWLKLEHECYIIILYLHDVASYV